METNHISELETLNVCVACLCHEGIMKPLFNETEVVQLYDVYKSLTTIQVSESDSIPKLICEKCLVRLNSAHEFKLQCQRSYETLVKYIENRLLNENKSNCTYSEHDDNSETIEYENVELIKMNVESENKENCSESDSGEELEYSENDTENGDEGINKIDKIYLSQEAVNEAIIEVRKKYHSRTECTYCGFTSASVKGLMIHMARLHKVMKEKWCNYCFKEVDDLKEHKTAHANSRGFICTICNKGFNYMWNLIEHIRTHSLIKPFKCHVCTKNFLFERQLRVHYQIHTREKPCSYDKPFEHTYLLQEHTEINNEECEANNQLQLKDDTISNTAVITEENKANDFVLTYDNLDIAEMDESKIEWIEEYCKLCHLTVKNLPEHMNEHREKNLLKKLCTSCGKRFSSNSKLVVHSRIHTGVLPYPCSYCARHFRTRGQLVTHERTHTGERPHVCSFCGKKFTQTSVLNTHMKIHTGRTDECQVCHKKFCRPAELKVHMRKHTGEKPFICDVCGQPFKQKSHLVEHAKIHTDERPFGCQYCGRGFKQNSSLKTHLLIHTGNKPFKCSICPYSCRQSHSLTQHIRHHNQPNLGLPTCKLCQKKFVSKARLTVHMKNDHEIIY